MDTYTLTTDDKKKDKLDLSGQYINGNLLIRNSSCSEINLEECRIEGHVIIDKNKSIVKLTKSEIKGCIIVNYVKDGDFLHLDQLIVKSDQESASKTSSNEHSVLFEKTDMFNIPDSGKVSVLIGDNGELQFEVDENLNANKEKGFKRTILNNNSLFIVNSQIKLNLDSSEIKGDVVIVDSTIASGTFDMSNAKFGDKKNNTTFEIKSTGIASDIEAKKVKFYGKVKFDDIRFDNEIYFSKSKFFKQVKFIDCTMYQECYFEGATFKKSVDLSETIFQGKASFKDITWGDNAYMKMHNGSAFLGYVDMTGEKLENYLFINVRGLRNIFYSLINNEHGDSLQFLQKWSNTCRIQFLEKLNSPSLKTIYKTEDRFNEFFFKIRKIFTNVKENDKNQKVSGVKLKYDNPPNLLNIEIEMYIEARRAMEDMAKEELITECHILEMEAQRRLASRNFVKWFRFTFLKYTTRYGESPFRIFAFIVFDWAFFSFLYWLIIKGHDLFGSKFSFQHKNKDSTAIHNDFLESIMHSADNLLSLNIDINNSCCIFIVIVTLFQGFVNIMIIALMTQVVFRKLDLR